MDSKLPIFLQRVRIALSRRRAGMRALVVLVAVAVIADPLIFERSIVHLLVGHSVVLLILLLLLLFVESLDDESAAGPDWSPFENRIVPALGFRMLTPLYDVVVRIGTRERLVKRALIDQADIQPVHHVLDLACGTGTLAVLMAQAQPSARVTGVDADPEILRRAQRKIDRARVPVRLERATADSLPFPDAQFDRVVSSLFFHHLTWPEKQRAAAEALRVLKPGGQLHIADWGRPENRLMRGLFVPVQLLDGFANTRDNLSGRLVELLEVAGFCRVVERRRVSTPFGTLALYSASSPTDAVG